MKKKNRPILSAIVLTMTLIISGVMMSNIMAAEASDYKTAIVQCAITGENMVTIIADSSKIPVSDDGLFYLFQQPSYGVGVTGELVAQAAQ